MFQLSVVDHIRFSFGDVVRSYKAHTAAADRFSRRAWQLKTAVLALLGVGVLATAGTIVNGGRPFAVSAAVVTLLGFVGYSASLALDLGPRIQAHRSSAARFWLICEKYRSLFTEIQDGLLDVAQVVERRDALIREVHGMYEQSPGVHREPSGLGRRVLASRDAMAVSDAEVEAFLPESVQRRDPKAA